MQNGLNDEWWMIKNGTSRDIGDDIKNWPAVIYGDINEMGSIKL